MAYGSKFGTINGHSLFECTSALQKSIRRGLVPDALYWAVELDLSHYGDYLWGRLLTITSEDVGLAWPEGPAQIAALYAAWQKFAKTEKDNDRLFLVHAILLLCSAPKSRVVDNALICEYTTHTDNKREVPDYAFDMHTQKGKSMGRGVDHFYDEGAMIDRTPASMTPHELVRDIDNGHDRYESLARILRLQGRKPPKKEAVRGGGKAHDAQPTLDEEEA